MLCLREGDLLDHYRRICINCLQTLRGGFVLCFFWFFRLSRLRCRQVLSSDVEQLPRVQRRDVSGEHRPIKLRELRCGTVFGRHGRSVERLRRLRLRYFRGKHRIVQLLCLRRWQVLGRISERMRRL